MRFRLLFGLMLFGSVMSLHAQCRTERENHYICDRAVLGKKLADARVIRVTSDHMDEFAADRTQQVVRKLGKQVAGDGDTADLTFDLRPIDRSGQINYGPNEAPLGWFKVYDAGHQLVWVETLDGNPDLPWAADVIQLLKRFQADVAGDKL